VAFSTGPRALGFVSSGKRNSFEILHRFLRFQRLLSFAVLFSVVWKCSNALTIRCDPPADAFSLVPGRFWGSLGAATTPP